MVRLTREVRFTLPVKDAAGMAAAPANGLSGNLVDGAGMYLVLQVTLSGELDPRSSYLENIKHVDALVRSRAVPVLAELVKRGDFTLARAVQAAANALCEGWSNGRVERIRVQPHPYLYCTIDFREINMVQLTQRFEFSAAHRLHNPDLDDEENARVFGKCSNPAGHGHNYEFEVTLAGEPDNTGRLIDPETFAATVHHSVIDRLDHKHLNTQTPEFAELNPSVENIARVIYKLLELQFPTRAKLRSVRVWETGKTFAEYAGAE